MTTTCRLLEKHLGLRKDLCGGYIKVTTAGHLNEYTLKRSLWGSFAGEIYLR